jgi:uncharacterized protein (DUF58 family)
VPPRGQRTLPTLTGLTLIVMVIGVGMAAYNSASNILFIAVSLLFASLIVSFILSWLNFRGICWRILTDPPFRVGEECHVRIEVRNRKRFLPTYALSFHIEAQQARKRKVLSLGKRLEPNDSIQLDFSFLPEKRGCETIRLVGVVSQFPFGFLRKTLPGGAPEGLIIWPRRVAYRFSHSGSALLHFSGTPQNKAGNGSEVINLREYRHGDSHRQIHWKASARLQNLVVQQFGAEHQSGFVLEINSDRAIWRDDPQFELLCSFISSLAEDLFRLDRLHGARVNSGAYHRVARRSDLDFVQDQLATLQRVGEDRRVLPPRGRSVVTFEPSQKSGIHAYVGGQKAATA